MAKENFTIDLRQIQNEQDSDDELSVFHYLESSTIRHRQLLCQGIPYTQRKGRFYQEITMAQTSARLQRSRQNYQRPYLDLNYSNEKSTKVNQLKLLTVGQLKKFYHQKYEGSNSNKRLIKKKCGISLTKSRKINIFNDQFKVQPIQKNRMNAFSRLKNKKIGLSKDLFA